MPFKQNRYLHLLKTSTCSMKKVDYYECLGITKAATHDEVKQAYRRLALKHHPDKNEDKEKAKVLFTQITEAYTVLNDPAKRQNYDKYGIAENQFAEFAQFQQFMNDFGLFEEFLDDFLAFDDLAEMQKMFSKMMGGGGNKKKGGSRRKRGGGSSASMNNMMNKMYEEMMKQMMKQFDDGDAGQDEDQEELTEEEMLLLQFGKANLLKKKKSSKKKRLICKFDEQKVEQDEILIHFGQKHQKEFEEWKVARKNGTVQQKKQEQK